MMAAGRDVFRSHFSAYQEQYILIGGMACDLLLNEAGERFRPTKDVDMVLINKDHVLDVYGRLYVPEG